MNKIVSREELEENLKRISSMVENPNYGIFGPHTKVWEVNRESCCFFGGTQAVLMQTAWPAVATSVRDHSKFKDDYIGRSIRTFENIFQMTLCDLDTAFKSARRVYNIHSRIKGTLDEHDNSQYAANHAESLLWVAATLWHTSIEMFELFVRRLSRKEKEQYYQESKRFAYLFALSDDNLPSDWYEFTDYYQSIVESDKLQVADSAKNICERLFIPHPLFSVPGYAAKTITAQMMPRHVAEQYGLPMDLRSKLFAGSVVNSMKVFYPLLPKKVRYLPQYQAAMKRIGN